MFIMTNLGIMKAHMTRKSLLVKINSVSDVTPRLVNALRKFT